MSSLWLNQPGYWWCDLNFGFFSKRSALTTEKRLAAFWSVSVKNIFRSDRMQCAFFNLLKRWNKSLTFHKQGVFYHSQFNRVRFKLRSTLGGGSTATRKRTRLRTKSRKGEFLKQFPHLASQWVMPITSKTAKLGWDRGHAPGWWLSSTLLSFLLKHARTTKRVSTLWTFSAQGEVWVWV